jgi:hypothetical protein
LEASLLKSLIFRCCLGGGCITVAKGLLDICVKFVIVPGNRGWHECMTGACLPLGARCSLDPERRKHHAQLHGNRQAPGGEEEKGQTGSSRAAQSHGR